MHGQFVARSNDREHVISPAKQRRHVTKAGQHSARRIPGTRGTHHVVGEALVAEFIARHLREASVVEVGLRHRQRRYTAAGDLVARRDKDAVEVNAHRRAETDVPILGGEFARQVHGHDDAFAGGQADALNSRPPAALDVAHFQFERSNFDIRVLENAP